jgi:hypothetical protein
MRQRIGPQPGGQPDAADAALAGAAQRIEPRQGAVGNPQPAASAPGEVLGLGHPKQAGSTHHQQAAAGTQADAQDLWQRLGGGAFGDHVGMLGQFLERHDRGRGFELRGVGARLLQVAGGDGGQAQARNSTGDQAPRHLLPRRAEPREANPHVPLPTLSRACS